MRVLLLGDSHTFGTYGSALEQMFREAGDDVVRVGWVGATAKHYLNGKHDGIGLGGAGDWNAAKAGRFDLAILTLGTNDAAALNPGQAAGNAASNIRALADQIQATRLVYVGPPAFSDNAARTYNPAFRDEDLNTKAARLWEAAAPLFQRAIDPRQATSGFVQKNEIHFGPKGGKAWAQSVFDAVKSETAIAPVTETAGGGGAKVAGIVIALAVVAGIGFWLWKRRK
jgi:lysophospholipase L1-like esterase